MAYQLALVPCGMSQSISTVSPRFDSSPARVVARVDRPEPPFTWATAMILVFMS